MSGEPSLRDLLAELAEEEAARLGEDAISVEDLVAFRRGELDDEAAERVLRAVAADRRWAETLLDLARFEDGEGAEVDDDEVEREWRALESTLGGPTGRLLRFRRSVARRPLASLAAALVSGIALTWLVLPGPGGIEGPQANWMLSLAGGPGEPTRSTVRGAEEVELSTADRIVDLELEVPELWQSHGVKTVYRYRLLAEGSAETVAQGEAHMNSDRWIELSFPSVLLAEGPTYTLELTPEASGEPVVRYEFRVGLTGPGS